MNNQINKVKDRKMLLFTLQLSIMYNATLHGWNIKKVSDRKFVITKKLNNMTKLDNNMKKLLEQIIRTD
jgi:hypothetical protein